MGAPGVPHPVFWGTSPVALSPLSSTRPPCVWDVIYYPHLGPINGVVVNHFVLQTKSRKQPPMTRVAVG